MKNHSIRSVAHSHGSALLIVLAFLLLLTTLTVAFLSRATFERELSNASFSQGKVDLAGQGAITAIIGDLQQEIVAGSNSGSLTLTGGFYYPNSPATVVPALVVPGYTPASIVGTGAENLLKTSQGGVSFWPSSGYNSAGPQRASSVSSKTASLNNRLISNVRWNKPLLMQPINVVSGADTTGTDYTPPAAFTGNPPDWVYVARDGSNPQGTALDSSYVYTPNVSPAATPTLGVFGTNAVTQRYAYAIYDEGSTLDLNSAGCPVTGTSGSTVTYSSNQSYKDALAYADLTQLPGIGTANGSLTALSATNQEAFVNAIVGWRNSATAQLTSPTSTPIFPNGYPSPFLSANATAFDNNVIFNPSGFLTVGGTALTKSDNVKGTANQSDNTFTSRQMLLQFFLQGLGQNTTFTPGSVPLGNLVGVLPYLGTFSRDVSQPSYASPVSFANSTAPTLSNNIGTGGNSVSNASGYSSSVDALINPAFLAVTVGSNSGTSGWIRNNGTIAVAGEPLVKKRFALMRLAWLTYKGPSANRNITSPSSTAGGADYDIYQMENTYEIPASFLAQGTAQNIYNYFGLTWVSDPNNSGSSEWAYSHSGAYATTSSTPSVTSASSLTSATILTLPSVAGLSSSLAREPDFFELLKAGLCVGSIGKAYTASNTVTKSTTNVTPAGSPADYYAQRDQDVDNTIIQIGANIISQYQPSGYPARILYDDGLFSQAYQEHRGVVDLPYIYGVQESKLRAVADSTPAYTTCPVAGTVASGKNGTAVDLQVPVIWNPHAWTTTSDNSDGNPRPTSFRIYAETCDPTFDATGSSPDPTKVISLNTAWRSAAGSGGEQTYHSGDAVTTPPAQPLTATNSAMTFSIPQNDNYLFREPTLLNKPSIPTGSSLAIDTTSTGASNFIKTLFSANFIKSLDPSPYYSQVTVSPPDNDEYIGVVLGGCTLPLAWTENLQVGEADQTNPTPSATNYAVPAEYTNVISGNYITYRLQYKDTNSNWITYDEKYGPILCATDYNFWNLIQGSGPGSSKGGWGWMFSSNNSEIISNELGAVCFDPRTSRWGVNYQGRNGIQSDDVHVGLVGPVGAGSATVGANPGWAAPVGTATGSALITYAAEQNAIWSARPDENRGFILSVSNAGDSLAFGYNTGPVAAGWYPAPLNAATSSGYTTAVIAPGLTCQNNMAVFFADSNTLRYAGDGAGSALSSFGLGCFADPDGVVRRGMAAYVPPTSTIPASQSASGASAASGIPLKPAYTFPTANSATLTANSELASRPIMLNRPFRSVADIGHVFSDTPWRNLDFSTPESGNPGFLDIFCINDTNDPNGLVAGKVNLNTRQAPVLQAILAGAYKDAFGTVPVLLGTSGTASVVTASVIAAGLVSRTTGGTNLVNIGDLVGKWSSSVTNANATSPNNIDGSQSYVGFSGTAATTSAPPTSPQNLSNLLTQDTTATGYNTNNVNRMREVAVRALANSGTTRVWNLMIDVIAQTGRFPSSASSLANFNVEGERRYWVHVAIDRYTGKVLDEQVEEVKE